MDSLLARGDLHVVADSLLPGAGGAAPMGGGNTGANSWMVLTEYWFKYGFDANHLTQDPVPRDLQYSLAHEADHLNGYPHIDPPDNYRTTHSDQCGGL
jgi:hypothetical protein